MTMIKGPLASLVICIFIYMITMGMITTSTFTLAMEKQGHRAGSASAVLGMLPLLLGSIVSPLVGINVFPLLSASMKRRLFQWGQSYLLLL